MPTPQTEQRLDGRQELFSPFFLKTGFNGARLFLRTGIHIRL